MSENGLPLKLVQTSNAFQQHCQMARNGLHLTWSPLLLVNIQTTGVSEYVSYVDSYFWLFNILFVTCFVNNRCQLTVKCLHIIYSIISAHCYLAELSFTVLCEILFILHGTITLESYKKHFKQIYIGSAIVLFSYYFVGY